VVFCGVVFLVSFLLVIFCSVIIGVIFAYLVVSYLMAAFLACHSGWCNSLILLASFVTFVVVIFGDHYHRCKNRFSRFYYFYKKRVFQRFLFLGTFFYF